MWPISGLGGAFHADFWSRVKYEISPFNNHETFRSTEKRLSSDREDTRRNYGSDNRPRNYRHGDNHTGSCVSVASYALPIGSRECSRNSWHSGNSSGDNAGLYSYSRGLAFFIGEKRKHYARLNNRVFKILADLVLPEPMLERGILFDGFRVLLNQFPFGAHAYPAALRHMEKDDIEAAKQLRALNDFLNQKVNEADVAKNTRV